MSFTNCKFKARKIFADEILINCCNSKKCDDSNLKSAIRELNLVDGNLLIGDPVFTLNNNELGCCDKYLWKDFNEQESTGASGPCIQVDVLVDKTVFVDIQFGNDGDGEVENLNKPFQTIQAAHAAAIANQGIGETWTVYVWPGVYVIGGIVLQNNINFFFAQGTVIGNNGMAPFFIDNGVQLKSQITGFGDFISQGSILLLTGNSNIIFQANIITSNSQYLFIFDTVSTFNMECVKILNINPQENTIFGVRNITNVAIVNVQTIETTFAIIEWVNGGSGNMQLKVENIIATNDFFDGEIALFNNNTLAGSGIGSLIIDCESCSITVTTNQLVNTAFWCIINIGLLPVYFNCQSLICNNAGVLSADSPLDAGIEPITKTWINCQKIEVNISSPDYLFSNFLNGFKVLGGFLDLTVDVLSCVAVAGDEVFQLFRLMDVVDVNIDSQSILCKDNVLVFRIFPRSDRIGPLKLNVVTEIIQSNNQVIYLNSFNLHELFQEINTFINITAQKILVTSPTTISNIIFDLFGTIFINADLISVDLYDVPAFPVFQVSSYNLNTSNTLISEFNIKKIEYTATNNPNILPTSLFKVTENAIAIFNIDNIETIVDNLTCFNILGLSTFNIESINCFGELITTNYAIYLGTNNTNIPNNNLHTGKISAINIGGDGIALQVENRSSFNGSVLYINTNRGLAINNRGIGDVNLVFNEINTIGDPTTVDGYGGVCINNSGAGKIELTGNVINANFCEYVLNNTSESNIIATVNIINSIVCLNILNNTPSDTSVGIFLDFQTINASSIMNSFAFCVNGLLVLKGTTIFANNGKLNNLDGFLYTVLGISNIIANVANINISSNDTLQIENIVDIEADIRIPQIITFGTLNISTGIFGAVFYSREQTFLELVGNELNINTESSSTDSSIIFMVNITNNPDKSLLNIITISNINVVDIGDIFKISIANTDEFFPKNSAQLLGNITKPFSEMLLEQRVLDSILFIQVYLQIYILIYVQLTRLTQ